MPNGEIVQPLDAFLYVNVASGKTLMNLKGTQTFLVLVRCLIG